MLVSVVRVVVGFRFSRPPRLISGRLVCVFEENDEQKEVVEQARRWGGGGEKKVVMEGTQN